MQTIEKQIKNFPTKEEIAKLPQDGGDRWNRLIFEQSPYLLQHAANPVDWFAWSDEAFEKAKNEDKPVMLSIGYATCHWCHVMEHECFEDQEVADVLNKYFVCIKVDREERPDIDNFYMTLAQVLIGRGGWPLNVFLTPERKVFYAATYVPKFSRQFSQGVSFGLMDLSRRINEYWKNQKPQALASADNLLNTIADRDSVASLEFEINDISLKEIYDTAFTMLDKKYDSEFGGFGTAPKFPSPHIFSFLLRYYKKTKNTEVLAMLKKTLTAMRLGGIYDQLGGGFHRYSTDVKWILPHFEKMLYDQAMLMIAYSELYEVTQDQFYKTVIEETFEYLLRDMQHSSGAFFSAEDADSEGEEGKFYVWSVEELKQVLSKDEFILVKNKFMVDESGNFLDEASHQKTGANILYLQDSSFINSSEYLQIKSKLFTVRNKRIRPLLDDKILTDWNALLVVAFVKASKATGDLKFLNSAKKILSFVFENLIATTVFKSYRQQRSNIQGCLNDYAFLAWALIEIYEVTLDNDFLNKAMSITDSMIKEFWSETSRAFSTSSNSSTEIPIQNQEFYDGAIPSGNSVAFIVLTRLFKLSQNLGYKNHADKLLQSFMQEVSRYPIGYAQFLCGLEYLFSDYQEQKFVCTEDGCRLA